MQIRKMKPNETDKVSELFAEGFYNDPLYIYFFNNPAKRAKNAKWLFKFELLRSADFTYVTENLSAAMIYKAPEDKYKNANPFFCVQLFFNVGIISVLKAQKYLKFCKRVKNKYCQSDMGYLSLLTVNKNYRKKGLAKSLITSITDNSVYLETQNPNNVPFYTKNGFKIISTESFSQNISHYVFNKSN